MIMIPKSLYLYSVCTQTRPSRARAMMGFQLNEDLPQPTWHDSIAVNGENESRTSRQPARDGFSPVMLPMQSFVFMDRGSRTFPKYANSNKKSLTM